MLGFFVRTSSSCSELVRPCRDLMIEKKLLDKITTVTGEPRFGGVKVFVNNVETVKVFLKEKFLKVSGTECTIYPLTTSVVLHRAVPVSEETFIRQLREVMKDKFGPVLAVDSVPIPEYNDIASGDWKITLDVPQIEDLDMFTNAGFPSDASIRVDRDKPYIISFMCSVCNEIGHSTLACTGGVIHPSPQSHRTLQVGTKRSLEAICIKKENIDQEGLQDFARNLGHDRVERYSTLDKTKQVPVEKKLKPMCGIFPLHDCDDVKVVHSNQEKGAHSSYVASAIVPQKIR